MDKLLRYNDLYRIWNCYHCKHSGEILGVFVSAATTGHRPSLGMHYLGSQYCLGVSDPTLGENADNLQTRAPVIIILILVGQNTIVIYYYV